VADGGDAGCGTRDTGWADGRIGHLTISNSHHRWSKGKGLFGGRFAAKEMLEKTMRFEKLEFTQVHDPLVGGRLMSGGLAEIHERERVPFAIANEFRGKRLLAVVTEDRSGENSEGAIDRMITCPAKPIEGVGIVRLTAMNDGVQEASIRIVNPLGDDMRRIEMIVPEQKQAVDQVAFAAGEVMAGKERTKGGPQFGFRQGARPRTRSQVCRAAGNEQPDEFLELGAGRHRDTIGSGGAPFNRFWPNKMAANLSIKRPPAECGSGRKPAGGTGMDDACPALNDRARLIAN
jgi:hypothetical protein